MKLTISWSWVNDEWGAAWPEIEDGPNKFSRDPNSGKVRLRRDDGYQAELSVEQFAEIERMLRESAKAKPPTTPDLAGQQEGK